MSKVVAIDGPSGSGKSTIAKLVAQKLGLTYLDTGAMFRALAWTLDQKHIAPADENAILEHINRLEFEYAPSEEVLIRIDQKDLSQKIREHQVSALASVYSKSPSIRNYLKQKQREIAQQKPSILEGRDIGSVIFPDALIKIYLTAQPEVRAKRRCAELNQKETKYSFDEVLADIKKRDLADKTRAVAPLVKASGAIEIDTSYKSIDEISTEIIHIFEKRKNLFYE